MTSADHTLWKETVYPGESHVLLGKLVTFFLFPEEENMGNLPPSETPPT